MRRVPSLRFRLTATLVLVLGAALAGFSLLLHAAFTRALSRQLDATLAAEARAAAELADLGDEGGWEVEPEAVAHLAHAEPGAWFELWAPDGRVLARSPNLEGGDLPRAAPARAPGSIRLPGGRRALLRVLSFPVGEAPHVRRITVAVARSAEPLDEAATTLWTLLAGSGAVTLVLAALVGVLATRRGLVPVGSLTSELERIDASALDRRLTSEALPSELQPIARTLNGLLARLQRGFERERELTADVSHELRTPLAGLRASLEVTAMRERSGAEYRAALGQALAGVGELQRLVESLLLLARAEGGQVPVERKPVALRALVEACLEPLRPKAEMRALRVENRIAEDAMVESDREKLAVLVANLLANAVEYTARGGWIRVELGPSALVVVDSGPPIPEHALEKVFERFFRADPSRTETAAHAGIGLALVRSLATLLGLAIRAENRPGGNVAFVVGGLLASPGVDPAEPPAHLGFESPT